MAPQLVFVSYATADFELALFLAGLVERRLKSPATVFVAKRDIRPGRDPRKAMLEEQLLKASALLALCSPDSRQSGWLWWEASSVWTREQLVVPLFVGIRANEFDGPMNLVLQGRSLFDPGDLSEALQAVAKHVSSPGTVTPLTRGELEQLQAFERAYQARQRRRGPIREQRLKELLDLVLDLKDAAFEAHDRGDRWSSKMANTEARMDTVLRQLVDEGFPPQVAEYARASHPIQVMNMWQQVHAMIQKVLLEESS
jgi:hypothetical protein